jgi:chaperonin GroEL (HSP60 family)
MRRRIENPRVLLLDCPLEYKKGESQTNIEVSKEDDWNRILQIEEEQVKHICDAIIAFKPDVVITEKGVSGKHLNGVKVQWSFFLTYNSSIRSRTALPGEAQHHCSPPRP